VALNPSNIEALNDLFEFYLEAPGFLGGGLDKSAALAEKIRNVDEVEYHYASARLAEKRKQFGSAEEHLRIASELAPRQVGRILDLARFLSKQGKIPESEAALARAAKIAPNSPKVVFEQARIFVEGKRNLPEARKLLKQYLSSHLSPDDPPRAEAEKLLRQTQGS
jgi:tetratricopeptide (TPR) repeat protein